MKKKIDLKKIMQNALPTEEELKEIEKKEYQKKLESKNNFSYWFPKIKDCGIKVPESIVIPLSLEWHHWLGSDSYEKDKIEEFKNFIVDYLKKNNFNTNRTLFLKNNNFSNKFEFDSSCKVTDIESIGSQFLGLNYASMIVGAGNATEVVVREFISHNEDIPTIYSGMPLNVEFRLFYDFNVHKVVTVCNYWDANVMKSSLPKDSRDGATYRAYQNTITDNFKKHQKDVKELAKKYLVNVNDISGVWSVDFMYVNDEFYLIDMATAETSYYKEKIADYMRKKML